MLMWALWKTQESPLQITEMRAVIWDLICFLFIEFNTFFTEGIHKNKQTQGSIFIYEWPYNLNDCSVTSKNKEHKVGVKKYISNEALSRYFLHLGWAFMCNHNLPHQKGCNQLQLSTIIPFDLIRFLFNSINKYLLLLQYVLNKAISTKMPTYEVYCDLDKENVLGIILILSKHWISNEIILMSSRLLDLDTLEWPHLNSWA